MFTHLHVHTEYSLLDGLSRIGPLVQRAKELGMDALAITDHGVMHGAIEFYEACRAAGIKPIIGCEVYLAQGSRLSRSPGDKSPYHLTVLAKDRTGYRNLLQLTTKAHLEGFYYKPRIDKVLLEEHRQGIVVLSGCPNAEVPRLLLENRDKDAREALLWYRDTFESFFVELQWHENIPFLHELNTKLIALAQELDVPLVLTNDSHYVYQEDAPTQDVLVCIQTNTNLQDDKRLRMSDDSFYLKSPQEMEALFPELPQAVENTQLIAQMCDLELDFSQLHLPQYQPPEGTTSEEYLERLCWEGLGQRFKEVTPEMEERLRYELEVIQHTQFANYFLVVWDIATFTREQGILFGVRGSAAASLALYCLGVTDINPLEYRLVFERFLNVERKEMPDIDMDFQDDRRDEVIEYVVKKYGQDHVAQIITFGTLGPKAAIRDVGRALGLAYADVDRVARLIPFRVHTLDEALETVSELRELYQDDTLRNLIDTARKLEGVTRHASTHAAGVVISREPLTEYVPLQRPVKGEEQGIAMTQYSMEPIARLGLLKMDLLGLANLTILDRVRQMVACTSGKKLDLRDLPLDDERTFELLSSGETTGVFQLEGAGMRRHIKELKPTSLNDLAAMIALYRPGPMEHIETFVNAKHGRAPIRYPHPALRDILEETYGVIVYQDQVLLIAQAFAGYSLGEADTVRKAMGKKIPEVMRQEREKFIQGGVEKGFERRLAEEVFNLIEPFAGYAFNKAHSVSYGLIAYWTAYFKANYPVEYMVAVLNAHIGHAEKTANAVAECQRLGIPVYPPDVSYSDVDFTAGPDDSGKQGIRFGLTAVKNVGASAVRPIVEARREGGPFRDLEDFCRRASPQGLNRRTLESLIKVGALDSLGERGTLLASLGRILAVAQQEAKLRQSGQATMFDLFGEAVPAPLGDLHLQEASVETREKLAWEKELLGVYLSENPMSALAFASKTSAIVTRAEIDAEMAGRRLSLVGQVSSVRQGSTKEGRPFAATVLELMDGSIDVLAWPDVYQATRELWQEGTFVWVVGKVRVRDDEVSISCEEAREYRLPTEEEASAAESPDDKEGSLVEAAQRPALEGAPRGQRLPKARPPERNGVRRLCIRLEETERSQEDATLLQDVLRIVLEFPGDDPLRLEILTGGRVAKVDMPSLSANPCDELLHRLAELLPESALRVETG